MPKYLTTDYVALPALCGPGHEVEYFGWPIDHLALQPVDDEAKAIDRYYRDNRCSGALPLTPFENGKLHLPPIGPPLWRLGKKFHDIEAETDPESRTLLRAIGHSVMRGYRSTLPPLQRNLWPEEGVEAVNEQAKQIVAWMAARPDGPFEGTPWGRAARLSERSRGESGLRRAPMPVIASANPPTW